MTNPSTPLLDILSKALATEAKSLFDTTLRDTVSDLADAFLEVTEPFLNDEQAAKVRDAVDRLTGTEPLPADQTTGPNAADDADLAAALAQGASLEHELADVNTRTRMKQVANERVARDLEAVQFEVDNLREVAKRLIDTVVTDESAPALPMAVKGFSDYLEDSPVNYTDIRDGKVTPAEALAEQQAVNARLRTAIDNAHSHASGAHSVNGDLHDMLARARGDRTTLTMALALPVAPAVSGDYVMRVDEYLPRLNSALASTNR